MKMYKKGLLFAAVLSFLLWHGPGIVYSKSTPGPDQPFTPFAPAKEHKKINDTIVDRLKQRHYLKVVIDDQFSAKMLSRFLDDLDPGHSYFYDQDIKEFETKYRLKLDDALNEGDLEPAFAIFNRYQQRVLDRLDYLIARIEQGFANMKFDVEETFRTDRKDIPWPNSEAAMDELWRKRLKSNVISLKLAEKSLQEIQKTLLRRFKNQLQRVQQNSSDDAFEIYINSLAMAIDPHTQYFSPHRTENFNINMSLSLEGIGAVLRTEDEFTKVVRLIPGGPAERSNLLKPSDRIVGVAQGEAGEMLDIV
ncbi:MAG: hypothetical protein R3297_07850, partial [Desulfobulbales bacterium]|nr:hypothetical protein [Desulfobulbales bacterium]